MSQDLSPKIDPKEQLVILESAINTLVHVAPEDTYRVQVQIAEALSRLSKWAGLSTREGHPKLVPLDDYEIALLVQEASSPSQLICESAYAQRKKIAALMGFTLEE